MRILHLLPHLSGGGAERQFSYLAPELVRMGHDVHVAYSTEGPNRPDLPGVVLHQFNSRSNYDPYLFWQLILLARRIKPDIIHTWILQMDILCGITAKINRIPWIFREPSSVLAYPSSWKHRLRVIAGSGASALVSNSQDGDDYWKNRLPNSRRYVITNSVPIDEIDKANDDLPAPHIESESAIVLYVGRLDEMHKRPIAFLEVFAYVKQRHNVLGYLCGDGPQRSELELLKHKYGLDNYIFFLGHLPAKAVWSLMKKTSVFVSLSAFEGCPNSVQEAMACGCPMVLSDIPAHRAILDETCALFVDPYNIQETADTIVDALCHADASRARALIAKKKSQEWSIAKMAQEYESVYKEAIANPSPAFGKGRKPATGQKENQ